MLCRATQGAARRAFASQATKPGLIDRLFFDAPSQNPLNEEFPGLPATAPKPAAAAVTQTTTLSNGLRVVTQDTGAGVASVALHVKAGSRHEAVPGSAFVLENIAYTATQKRSALKFQRDVEDLGATVDARAGRETFVWSGEGLRENAGALTALLAEAATQLRLEPWDITEAAPIVDAAREAAAAQPGTVIAEALHAAAFGENEPLGRSLYGPAGPAGLADVDPAAVKALLGARAVGRAMVLSGVNVDHATLVEAADKYLAGVREGGPLPADPTPVVLGGATLMRTHDAGVTRVGVALEGPGLDAKSAYAAGVLQALLGGTGPGGGGAGALRRAPTKQARIPRSIHTEAHSFIHSLAAFSTPYSDTGLLGLVGAAADHEAGRLVDAMAGFLKDAVAVPATPAELARAKTAFKLSLLLQAGARAGARDAAPTRLLLSGRVVPVAEALKAIDAVTAGDVAAVAKAALASPPSIAAVGSTAALPRYDVFAGLFK